MNLYEKKANDVDGFLFFPSDFSISGGNSIIFAPNGTGKTTLFNILLDLYKDQAVSFSYAQQDEDLHFDGEKLIISTTTDSTESLKKKIKDEENAFLVAKPLGNFFEHTTKKDLKDNPYALQIYGCFMAKEKGIEYQTFEGLSETQRVSLSPFLKNPKDLGVLLENEAKVKKNWETKKSIDLKASTFYSFYSLFAAYDPDSHQEELKSNGCPFCGRPCDTTLLQDIKKQQEKANSAMANSLNKCECIRNCKTGDEAVALISEAIDALNELTIDQKRTLVFTQGDAKKEKDRKKQVSDLQANKKSLDEAIQKQDALFSFFKSGFESVKLNIETYYPGSSVLLDESKKSIVIALPRDYKAFSDGERHRLYELAVLFAFLGSDKNYLFIDDPLTQLDFPNQYQIVFDFNKIARGASQKKALIIFTCNPSLISLSYSQDPSNFSYFYLESFKREKDDKTMVYIRIKPFGIRPENYKNIFDLSLLFDCPLGKYVRALSDRNSISTYVGGLLEKKQYVSPDLSARLDTLDLLFHYDRTVHIDDCSTEELLSLVGNYHDCNPDASFSEASTHKIVILAAIRVWIEYRLYLFGLFAEEKIHERIALSGDLFSKIKKVSLSSPSLLHDFFPNWDADILKSRKVMINDDCHPNSQTAPFIYAITVSEETINSEIKIIKNVLEINPNYPKYSQHPVPEFSPHSKLVGALVDYSEGDDYPDYLRLVLLPKDCSKAIFEELHRIYQENDPLSLFVPLDWMLIPKETLRKRNVFLEEGTFVALSFSDFPGSFSDDQVLLGKYSSDDVGNNTGAYLGYCSLIRKAENGFLDQIREKIEDAENERRVILSYGQ
jgi:ABC-type cobalamin/Fe3+-siderophores transport system ATPase subunit